MALELALDAELDFEQIPCVQPGRTRGFFGKRGVQKPDIPGDFWSQKPDIPGDFSFDFNIWGLKKLLFPQS